MISRARNGHSPLMDDFGADPPGSATASEAAQRLRGLVATHLDFVWRSLRRLDVCEADCDDGCQRVWMVLMRKFESIEPGKERSYIFSVTLRVASEMRRRDPRRRDAELSDELAASDADPEEALRQRRDQELLTSILQELPLPYRTVFMLYELEGLGTPEIGEMLEIPRGTAASRLRKARELFSAAASRARTQPAPGYPVLDRTTMQGVRQ